MRADDDRGRRPIEPGDPLMRSYTELEVVYLIDELRERGREFGLLWPSAETNGVVDGRVLVRFGNAPASTVVNLLALLRDLRTTESEGPCAS
ncbi:hypothetical protein [Streptomyces rubellomurinus]|uniref:Uncharacterized protein n=1 Tax=Streptomyces rubellomurinus (strain ATCC 31215) TaxID=359131 RepID=A0A0F2TH57_STRR3|nr:hypothetical protein [Streptomyces rubellomurinus]KJS61891.1 hypothetical protein VM95_12010 [Streptomyces rubellomurinus]